MDRFYHCIMGRSAWRRSVREYFLQDVNEGNKTIFQIEEKETNLKLNV